MAHNFLFEMRNRAIEKLAASFLLVLLFSIIHLTNGSHDCYRPECVLLPTSNKLEKFLVEPSKEEPNKVRIFCFPGQERTWHRLWVNPRITVTGNKSFSPEDLSISYGKNVSEVKSQLSGSSLFGLSAWLLLKEEHSFSPFNLSCIGISSPKAYSVHFWIKNPDLWYLTYIAVGIVIFFFAPAWSRNTALHYGTGVTVGILASLLIIMFVLTRLMPQRLKTISYVVLAVSSSASLFMWQLVKNYLQEIVHNHWQVALGYVLVSGLVSFALIYRFGPMRDERSLNLVCWLMQALGLVLVYQGTQIPEASAALILLMVTIYLVPKSMPYWLRSWRFRLFPPQRRFLTEEEYQLQGEEETKRALDELREFCNSPDCNTWRIVRRLKSPSQFAKYVDGAPHVSDDEVEQHERAVHFGMLSRNTNYNDDSDSSMEYDDELSRNGHHSNHANDGFDDLESDIEETAWEGSRLR